MSVETEPQNRQDYHKIYNQLDQLLDIYHENFEQNFQFRQNALIEQLEEKSKLLKKQIGKLQSKTSEAAISKLIEKRKQKKQGERLKLEMNWRELTQKLKKYQEEQKKLINQNEQSKFDIENLREKIKELSQENTRLTSQISHTQQFRKHQTFITQYERKTYQSPYKSKVYPKIELSKTSQKPSYKKNLTKRLKEVRAMKQVPTKILMQFIGRKYVKNQIFDILHL